MKKIDVLCVGVAAYDLVFSLDHHPGADEKSIASSMISCGGGPAANAAVTVARLGYRSAFIGSVGNDLFGARLLQEFKDEGVLTDLVAPGRYPTSLSAVLVKPDGRRTVVYHRGNRQHISPGSVDYSRIKPKVCLFDGHEPDLSLALVKYARSRDIVTILDAGSMHQGTKALMPVVDYLVCSERFANEFTGEKDEKAAVTKLYQFTPSVVITLGERGLVWKNKRSEGALPAFSMNVVDTTGAGDAFHGAFASCIASGCDWEYTLKYSSAVAALCCTKLGARTGIPYMDDIQAFLKNIKDEGVRA